MKKQLLTDCYSSPLGNSRPSSLGKGLILSSLVMGMFWGSQAVQASTIFNQPGPFTGAPLATTTFPDSDALDLAVTDFTMSACVYQTARNLGYSSAILTKRGSANGWALLINGESGDGPTGTVKLRTGGLVKSNQTLSLNTWYHVAVVYQAGQAQIFINGAPDGTKTIPHPTATEKVLRVGGDFDYSKWAETFKWRGTLSNLKIDNTALSQAQIQTLCASCGGASCVTTIPTPPICPSPKDGTRGIPITPGPTYNLATGELYIPQLSIIGSTQICEMYLQQQPLLSDFSLDASRLICK